MDDRLDVATVRYNIVLSKILTIGNDFSVLSVHSSIYGNRHLESAKMRCWQMFCL